MSEENVKADKMTVNTRVMRKGPLNAAQRKEAKALFLESLRVDPNISLACDCANISRDAVYKWREKDSQFARDWDSAIERTKDVARSSIYQRAVIGWLEPMVSAGQVVCEEELLLDDDGNPRLDKRGKPIYVKGAPKMVRKHSDTLAVAYAKGNLPEYKEKQQLDINADVHSSTSITIDTRDMSPKQLIELKSFALRLKEGTNG